MVEVQRVRARAPMFLRAFLYFLSRYITPRRFLDGVPGLMYHVLQGFWFRFYVDACCYELRNSEQSTVNKTKGCTKVPGKGAVLVGPPSRRPPMRVLFINRFFFPDHSAAESTADRRDVSPRTKQAVPITVVTSRQTYRRPFDQLSSACQRAWSSDCRVWSQIRPTTLTRTVDRLCHVYVSALWNLFALTRKRR